MILDSNIIIDYLNGDKYVGLVLDTLRTTNRVLFISQVTVIEALSLQTLSATEIERICSFLQEFITLPLDTQVSLHAAEMRRAHRLTLADSIIVASAHIHNLPLATRDKKMRSLPDVIFAEI